MTNSAELDDYYHYEVDEPKEDRRDHQPEPEWGEGPFWCVECKRPCDVIEVDFGIGPYEYWGAPGCDVQIAAVSECHECDFTEVDPSQVEPSEDDVQEEDVA